MAQDDATNPDKGDVHCVLLASPQGDPPARLLAALQRREIRPAVIRDPYRAMAELCERGRDESAAALILLLLSPIDPGTAGKLVQAAEIYVPRASVWVFDPAARPELHEIDASTLIPDEPESEIVVSPDIEAIARGSKTDAPPKLRLVDDSPPPSGPTSSPTSPSSPPTSPPPPTPGGPSSPSDPLGPESSRPEPTAAQPVAQPNVQPSVRPNVEAMGGVVGPGFSATNLRPSESPEETPQTGLIEINENRPNSDHDIAQNPDVFDPIAGDDLGAPTPPVAGETDGRVELTPDELNMLLGETSNGVDTEHGPSR